MTVKSIVDIEVNTGSFRNFQAIWEKYQNQLKNSPEQWAAVQKKIQGTKVAFDALVAGMVASNVQSKLLIEAQAKADRITRTSAENWQKIARDTKQTAINLSSIAVSMLKFGAISSLVTGLVGVGSLFGLDKLGGVVSGWRRSSLGLGASYGGNQAFNSNFERFVDPNSFLSNVAEAKFDVTKRVGLQYAGLSESEINGDTADTGVALLKRLKKIADTTNPALYGTLTQNTPLGQVTTAQDLERLHRTSQKEFDETIRKYGTTKGQFDIGDDTALKFQNFITQMSNAGKTIENVFVTQLSGLIGPLTHLSDAFSDTVRSLLGGKGFKQIIEEVGSGLETFATYVGTDKFQQDVKDFAEGLSNIVKGIGRAVKWFASNTPGTADDGTSISPLFGKHDPDDVWEQMKRRSSEIKANRSALDAALSNPNGVSATTGDQKVVGNKLIGLVRQLEGSGDRAVSPAGAIGRYQIMPATAAAYGFDPSKLMDPVYNETAATAILADLVKKYKGNLGEVLVGYNAGPGRANKYRDSGDNPATLPLETQKYLAHAQRLGFTINDNTGGNVNITTQGTSVWGGG